MDRLLDVVRTWIEWKKIEPLAVASSLGRRLQLRREDAYVAVYDLVGGPAIPFASAQAIHLKKLGQGEFSVRLCEAVRIPMPDIIEALGGYELFSPLFPDPRDPHPEFASIRRIPMGEFRLIYPQAECVDTIVVSETQLLDWGE